MSRNKLIFLISLLSLFFICVYTAPLKANCGSCPGDEPAPASVSAPEAAPEPEVTIEPEPEHEHTTTELPPEFEATGVNLESPETFVVDDSGEEDVTYKDPADCALHHCAGHRLLIIIGNSGNKTINAVLNWAKDSDKANYTLFFSLASTDSIPTFTSAKLLTEKQKNKKTVKVWDGGSVKKVAKKFNCCFFEEVIVFSHGSKGRYTYHQRLIEQLPAICGGRPIKKLVLFMCNSSADIYPEAGEKIYNDPKKNTFEKYCSLMLPKKCPCDCKLDLCDKLCLNPEGQHPAGYRCPSADDSTEIFMAAWHSEAYTPTEDITVNSQLGFNHNNLNQPLTSPNGQMRKVTISKEGKATSEIVNTPTVFGDLSISADSSLGIGTQMDEKYGRDINGKRKDGKDSTLPNEIEAQRKYREKRKEKLKEREVKTGEETERLKDVNVAPPDKPAEYDGPKACAGGEGCLLGTL